ncbi:hypothetical protein BDW22DRAFT_1416107 [Trametopsis cervina]|nr:hypothetical protein BDW22DRAFT_1416107 [Trametopsis cervina]
MTVAVRLEGDVAHHTSYELLLSSVAFKTGDILLKHYPIKFSKLVDPQATGLTEYSKATALILTPSVINIATQSCRPLISRCGFTFVKGPLGCDFDGLLGSEMRELEFELVATGLSLFIANEPRHGRFRHKSGGAHVGCTAAQRSTLLHHRFHRHPTPSAVGTIGTYQSTHRRTHGYTNRDI